MQKDELINRPPDSEENIAICTVFSKNYLAFGRTFSKSVREQHPDLKIFVLLVDRLDGMFDPAEEPFELVEIESLDNIPNPGNFYFKYKPIELNTAVKPYFFEFLFRKYNLSKLIYFDPDILVLDSLKTIWDLLDSNNIVLTPHITKPYTDDLNPDEKHILQSGIFNLGFIAMANTPVTNDFLRWWKKRLYDFCFMNISEGMHVDQNWVNFAPVMCEGVHILKDPAYNIAYWNLHYRSDALHVEQGKWKIHDKPVVFFHFSGFDTGNIEQISKHQDRFMLKDLPMLRPLFEYYRTLLLENDHQNIRKWKYAYDYFENGALITEFVRSIYNFTIKSGTSFENPFETKSAESFFHWLNTGIDTQPYPVEFMITNLMAFIYTNRIDLKAVYPKPLDRDRRAFIQWYRTFGKRECQLDDAFIPGTERFRIASSYEGNLGIPEVPQKKKVIPASHDKTEKQKLPFGMNVAGYFNGEFGVAEAARGSVHALQTTRVPFVLNNIIAPSHRHEDHSFTEFSSDNPNYINLIHVNADQAKFFRELKGDAYFKDRYNIGVWFWELENFPEKWFSSFRYYDEIWAKSEFCRQTFAKVSPVPVRRIKNPIIMDEKTIKPDRKRFLLPEDEFVFLFLFDYRSIFERKNPEGTIRAFQKAFGKNDKVCLLIKSINSKAAPEEAKHIQTIAEGANVRFIDSHLDPGDMLSLMATVDCFVSLHRSEGLGLGMAQSMYLGKPVIATWYSGNMDFMKPGNSFLVNYQLVELEQDYGPYEKGNVWAEPDADHAAELMRIVCYDRALAERKAQQAAWDIRMEFSPKSAGAEMQARVRQIYEGEAGSVQRTPETSPEKPAEIAVLKSAEVSIVIPVFNKLELTRQCLDTIRQTHGNVPCEIIIVDNGSNDGTAEYLRQEEAAGRLTALRNTTNLGFAKACNQGAGAAKGKYILFLNNDTIPQPGWLEEMVSTAESDENIAVVGSKLLFPDGTIQHTGVVVWKNKRPYHIYKGCAADFAGANIERDYQIVTAACMLVKKETFSDIGGFDTRYVNGMEDVDFCLKVGQKNKRIVYNPKSVVIHLESQTEGRQDSMDANRVLFEQTWRDRIRPDDEFYLRQDGMVAMVDLNSYFYFVPIKELSQLSAGVIIVTFNSASTIRACLDSVLQHTPNAEVIVVDNASSDETRAILENEYKGRVTAMLNDRNKGFSFACNQGIRASKGEYIILLNPDTVVTPMWKERLLAHFSPGVGAVGPLTNYVNTIQLSSFYAREPGWEKVNTEERARKLYGWNRGQWRETPLLMGFCLAFPRKVLDEVGLLDEDLFLGSEDLEISWRLRQRGYKLLIATDTFVYHEGQVSFKSQDTPASELTQESADKLYAKLEAHYGQGNVPHPVELWGIDYFRPRGARFRSVQPLFAAVYCVYDDVSWLTDSLESVYPGVDAVYFLLSDKPWYGQPTGNAETIAAIREFPDTGNKIRIIQGLWTNETDQRNAGLDMLEEAGFTYCVVIDADEIYDPAELKKMKALVLSRPEVDCWHVSLDTYWKSYRYRIEPREPLKPPVFVKTGEVRFTQNRTARGSNHMVIPPETGICHHLSYAHSDDEVLKKISTFSHANEVITGWFENVWKKWDTDHEMTNLHPTHPHAYQKAAEQPFASLPPILRRRYLKDKNIPPPVVPGLTSIIILAHNQWVHTELCLLSIAKNTVEPHEIIVVDNGSGDETNERLMELADGTVNPPDFPLDKGRTKEGLFSRLKVITNKENLGFAAGNNQGLAIAQGEFVVLLNNDTVVTPGWLGRMRDVFRRHPETGVVGPMSNYVSGPQLAGEVPYKTVEEIGSFAERWSREHEGQSFPIYRVVGFCLLARRALIDRTGGLDEQFGSGNFEDDDFCLRAALAGYSARVAQDVFIHHTGSQTFKIAGINFEESLFRNWELFKSKWGIPQDTPYGTPYQFSSLDTSGISIYEPLPCPTSECPAASGDSRQEEKEQPATEREKEAVIQVQETPGEKEREMEKKRSRGDFTSILVLLSERREYSRKCVESIRAHTNEPHEIIFIPPGTEYAPPKWLRRMLKENKDYKLINNISPSPSYQGGDQGGGFSRACNLGIADASGRDIVLVDDATVVTEDWLAGMLECLHSAEDTGIVGPLSVNTDGQQNIPDPGDISPDDLDGYARSFRELNRYRRAPAKYLDSFCMLFRHELTEKAGLFDAQFRTHEFAAHDFCLRTALEGFRNLIAGDVFIHFHGHRNIEAAAPGASPPVTGDKRAFIEKWGDGPESLLKTAKGAVANALFLADELLQKGQKENAIAVLVEGLQAYPGDARLPQMLAGTLIDEGKFREALDVLERMPEDMKQGIKSLELFASCKEGLGLLTEAEQYADRVLSLNSASPRAWVLKGTLAFRRVLYFDAEKHFQKARESDRGFGEAYANLGALKWQNGKKEEALEFFRKAFVLTPVHEDVVTNYYSASVNLKKLAEAEKPFREAIALYPFNRRLKFIFIDNLLQQQKFQEAMQEIQEGLLSFGIDDSTLEVALKLRDMVGALGIEIGTAKTQQTQGTPETSGTISLCMIVKNEEENIGKALHTIQPAVDELIVVDTGSTDRTKKIARAFGAKVYEFAWTNDFSAARNFSLSKASGDWILVLDADEVISSADHNRLRALIPDSSFTRHPSSLRAYSFVTRNYVGPVSVNWNPNDGKYREEAGSGWFPSAKVRLFPHDARIRFDKPVHETVEKSLRDNSVMIRKSEIPIHHYGKLEREVIQAKGEEYYQIGKKKLEEMGEQNPQALYEIAIQASELEKFDESLEYWQRLIAARPDFPNAFHGMGTAYYKLGRYGDAHGAFQRAALIDPSAKDPGVMLALCELLMGNAGPAISRLEALLAMHPGYPLALLAITTAYYCEGRKDRGMEYLGQVRNTQFTIAPYFTDIAKLLKNAGRTDSAFRLLESAVETGNTTEETRQLLEECRREQNEIRVEGKNIAESTEMTHSETRETQHTPEAGITRQTLSLCMIVKNEEENIERALLSVKPVVDEMIVVDTGSFDGTREIAKRLGAKVSLFPWSGNFSDARNFAISQASGSWILILDADEVISPADHNRLRELLHDSAFSLQPSALPAYSLTTRNYVVEANTAGWTANDGRYFPEEAGSGWFPGEKVRLFPKDSRIQFEFPVHERIEPSLVRAGIEIRKSGIPVHHYGKLDREKARAKAEHYYQLGKTKLSETGTNDAMALYELAVQGAETGKYDEALDYLKQVVSLMPDFAKAYQSIGNVYFNTGRYEDARAAYLKALEKKSGSRDAVLMYATCLIYTGDAERSLPLLQDLIREHPEFPQAILLLAEAGFCLGKKEDALQQMKTLKSLPFELSSQFVSFARKLISLGQLQYAVSLLRSSKETGLSSDETGPLLAEAEQLLSKRNG